jgi:ParB family transcriptional regulator, chromosome partitioning protein
MPVIWKLSNALPAKPWKDEMPASLTSVGLNEVDLEDDRFAIQSFLPHTRLMNSLDRRGILSPVWLWERTERKGIVVDGFKRLEWAKEKGLERIPCSVFPKQVSAEEMMLNRVEGKLFGPPLNVAEKAQIVSNGVQTLPRQHLMEYLLPALGIAPRLEVMKKWCLLADAGAPFLESLVAHGIHDRAALELAGWEEERTEGLALLTSLRCTASIQMEIVERVKEIALREHREKSAVLRREELKDLLTEPDMNHRQKTEAVRTLLSRWRFPRLRAREERFAGEWAAASLPRAIRMMPPAAFEGERWQLQVAFSSPEELRELLQEVIDFADSSRLGSIISSGVSP